MIFPGKMAIDKTLNNLAYLVFLILLLPNLRDLSSFEVSSWANERIQN